MFLDQPSQQQKSGGWRQNKMPIGLLWIAVLTLLALPGQAEQPVGLVLEAQGGELLRAGTSLPLTAKAGDVLFADDSLRTPSGTISLLYCPTRSSQTLTPKSEAFLLADQVQVKSGELIDKTEVPVCILPPVERRAAASQQHYGGSIIRDLQLEPTAVGSLESRLQRLPEAERNALRQALEPVEEVLARNPDDQAARVARAALFDQYNLSTDALQEYRYIAEKWPDAAWVKSRLFIHDQQQAAESLDESQRETALEGEGQTYALLVGISSYQDPQVPSLQFAHEDAILFEKHLKSPRGGGLPDENVVRLINQEATTAAVRLAFDTFLKAEAGPNDTVLVFVASHGTVDPQTREGFVVTYDSDPQDLASTALPMADLQKLVREELGRVKRVHVYVDVCHAGKIGTIEAKRTGSTRLSSDWEKPMGKFWG